MTKKFATEAALVAKFIELVEAKNREVIGIFSRRNEWFGDEWIVYPETAGFDLVLRGRHSGVTIGIEAKLSLNAKSLCQAVQGAEDYYNLAGPDYRAVLVPSVGKVSGMGELAKFIGITVITVADYGWDGQKEEWRFTPELPRPLKDGRYTDIRSWHPWVPGETLSLPDYVPDSVAGSPSPLTLTHWKIAAIKICILLDRRGYVTRRDFKVAGISPTRWCDAFHGYLEPAGKEGRFTHYIACRRTPDFRVHHPRNYQEIEDDWPIWSTAFEDLP